MGAFRFVFPAILAGLACLASAQHGENKLELFKWFETLGFEKRLTGEFVVYESTRTRNGKSSTDSRTIGFRRPGKDRFEHIATFCLYEMPIYGEAILRPGDFRSEARFLLNLQAKFREISEDPSDEFDKRAPWSESSEPFVMSWFALQKGAEDISDELFEVAVSLAKRSERDLKTALLEKFSFVSFGDIQTLIADPVVPFSQVRTSCVSFVKNYPSAKLTPSVRLLIQSIDATTAGDRVWESRPKREGQAGQIDELIYRLKEQTGEQSFNKAPASVFRMFRRDGETTPADRLRDIGYSAIPDLVAALADRRLTRTVASMWVGEQSVLYVGDAARQIIEAILPVRPDSEHHSDWKDNQFAYGQAVLKTLDDIHARGERTVILEALQSPYLDYSTLRTLTDKYPADAIKFISSRLPKETDDWHQQNLLEELGRIEHPDAKAMLIKVLESDSSRDKRIIAAEQLAKTEPDRVFKALVKEWKTKPGADLAELLIESGRKEAIAVIDADFSRLARDVAFKAAEYLGSSSSFSIWRDYGEDEPSTEDPKDAEFFRASEALLVRLLADTRAQIGLNLDYTAGEVGFEAEDPRICDMAAFSLGRTWSAKYPFVDSDSEYEMDIQRIAFANIWRKANGQPLLPIPTRPVAPSVDAAVLSDALDKFVSDPTRANRAAIVRLGIGALPGIESRLKSTGSKDLESLAQEVSLIVREVKIEGSIAERARKLASSLKHEPLTGERVTQLLSEVEASVQKDGSSFTFSARRLADGMGFLVVIQVDAPPPGAKPEGEGNSNIWIGQGDDCLLSMSGGGGFFNPPVVYEDISKELKKALSAPRSETIRISYSLTRQ